MKHLTRSSLTRSSLTRSCIARSCIAITTAATLSLTSFVVAPPARAGIPGPGLVFSAVKLLRNRLVEKPRARRDVTRNRDVDLRTAAAQLATVNAYRSAGFMPTDLYQQQKQRYADLSSGIKERARIEVKITNTAYDRAFGTELRNLALNALTNRIGIDTKAGRFVSQLAEGKDPLTAALALIPDPKASPVGQRLADLTARYDQLQAQLQQARAALRYVRDPSTIPIQQELNRLLSDSTAVVKGGVPSSDLERKLNELGDRARAVRDRQAGLKQVIAQLRPESPNVNRQRFQNDDAWKVLNTAINAAGTELGNAPRAGVAAMNRANERWVKDMLAASGIKLTDVQLTGLLLSADVAYLRAARDARTAGQDPNGLDREQILRDAMDAGLIKLGLTTVGAVVTTPATTATAATVTRPTSAPTIATTTAAPTAPPTTRPTTTATPTTRPTSTAATTKRATTTTTRATTTTAAEQWVVWFATKIGYNPIYVSTKKQFEAPEKSCNYPGGGIDCTIPMEKTFILGPYPTRDAAMAAICASLTDYWTMGGIYAGMRMAKYQGVGHNIDNLSCRP